MTISAIAATPAPTPDSNQVLRTFAATADTSTIRTAKLREREHLIVPVVALIGNHVFRPMNSDGPEFVPLSELEVAPMCWDSKPVVPDHPSNGLGSACTPEMLESFAFGTIFNSRIEDGKLKMDAWLDVARAEQLGGDAANVVSRVRAGKMVEVSVGARTILEHRPGRTADGVAYTYVWRGVWPDHLAALPEDATGACSVDAGCGLPRAARLHPHIAHSFKEIRAMSQTQPASLMGALAAIRSAALTTTSDTELRSLLEAALFGTEPGFQGVLDVFSEENYVVYYAMDAEMNFHIYRSKYTIGDDKAVSFSRRTEVKTETKYVPLEAGGTIDAAVPPHDCKCGKHLSTSATPSVGIAASLASEGGNMSTEVNPAATSAEPEVVPDAPVAETVVASDTESTPEVVVDSNTVTISTEELQSLRAMAAAFQAHEEAVKEALVKSLSAHPNVKPVMTVEALREKSIPDLECLAKIVGSGSSSPAAPSPVNFSLVRPLANVDPEPTTEPAPMPDPFTRALKARATA